jgi:hypothetical protein
MTFYATLSDIPEDIVGGSEDVNVPPKRLAVHAEGTLSVEKEVKHEHRALGSVKYYIF